MIQKFLEIVCTENLEALQERGYQTSKTLTGLIIRSYKKVFTKKVLGIRLDAWAHEVLDEVKRIEHEKEEGGEPTLFQKNGRKLEAMRNTISHWNKSECMKISA